MGLCVTAGAQLMCSFGTAPQALNVLPQKKVLCGAPVATILDNIPMNNIPPFAMCTSLANPAVAAATTAAFGVLTPQPCVPVLPAPWAPGSVKVLVGGTPAIDNLAKLTCAYGGIIQILNPGQQKTMVG